MITMKRFGALLLGICCTAWMTVSAGSGLVPSDKGTLIVYFSHGGENYGVGKVEEGNTKVAVREIASVTGGDVFEIVSLKNYDMSYEQLKEEARREHERGEMPEYADTILNIMQYDTVIVCGPIWWDTYPMVMSTFFSRYDLNGKVLMPFTTHEGSGMGRVREDLAKRYPGATMGDGLAVYGHEVRTESGRRSIDEWLKKLGY